jgi:hypothetical protein
MIDRRDGDLTCDNGKAGETGGRCARRGRGVARTEEGIRAECPGQMKAGHPRGKMPGLHESDHITGTTARWR